MREYLSFPSPPSLPLNLLPPFFFFPPLFSSSPLLRKTIRNWGFLERRGGWWLRKGKGRIGEVTNNSAMLSSRSKYFRSAFSIIFVVSQ